MSANTNWRAMQAAGSFQDKTKLADLKPSEVKPRYFSMGSWKASLMKQGQKVSK